MKLLLRRAAEIWRIAVKISNLEFSYHRFVKTFQLRLVRHLTFAIGARDMQKVNLRLFDIKSLLLLLLLLLSSKFQSGETL